MTVFALKLIAMLTMVIDHAGLLLCDNNMVMRTIGRFAFLTYAFLMAEGYYHLKDKADRLRFHMIKMCVLAAISEPLHDLCIKRAWLEFKLQNALFTLMIGYAALIVSDRWKKKHGENREASVFGCIVIVTAAAAVSYFLRCEYDIPGTMFIVLSYHYLCRADSWNLPQRLGALLGIVAVFLFFQMWIYSDFGGVDAFVRTVLKYRLPVIGAILAIIPPALYNRELGYRSKWFGWLYSGFYPLQFAALALIMHWVK